ncbi:MAG: NAD(P)H-hydrate dehydratase, partial [Planctomycetota bacterium]|jgi:NAD(P)H-hydrate epimerase
VIASADRHVINTSGNPSLATAGSGDILTGAIASFIAQGMAPFDAAALGAHIHGAAADLWAAAHGPAGLLARDLADLLPDALNAHRKASP